MGKKITSGLRKRGASGTSKKQSAGVDYLKVLEQAISSKPNGS